MHHLRTVLKTSTVINFHIVIPLQITNRKMKYEETKNKLEEYRQKKLKEEAQSSRRQFIWDIVTLQPVRRNLLRNKKDNENEEKQENKPPEDDDEEIKDRTWTRIDYAILFVKFLVWACIQVCGKREIKLSNFSLKFSSVQMIFVQIEFGSVFFIVSCILFMTSNLGKR